MIRSPTVRSRAGPSTLPRSIRPRRRTPAAARMSLYAHSCFSERPVARDDIGKACHPPMIRTACPIHRDASVEPKLAVYGAPLGGPQQMVMRDADRMQRRFDLAVPEVDEIEQCREVRRQTIVQIGRAHV